MKPQVQKALERDQELMDEYYACVESEISNDIKDPSDALLKYGSIIDWCFISKVPVRDCAQKIIDKVYNR